LVPVRLLLAPSRLLWVAPTVCRLLQPSRVPLQPSGKFVSFFCSFFFFGSSGPPCVSVRRPGHGLSGRTSPHPPVEGPGPRLTRKGSVHWGLGRDGTDAPCLVSGAPAVPLGPVPVARAPRSQPHSLGCGFGLGASRGHSFWDVRAPHGCARVLYLRRYAAAGRAARARRVLCPGTPAN